jgi:uncharacterized protein YeaO (DUF488 family)
MPSAKNEGRPAKAKAKPSERRSGKAADAPLLGKIGVRRAYEPLDPGDGQRVLVDRLWPRGLSKRDLADALWIRDVAPSTELRKWFGHKPERWTEFRRRYFAELRANPAVEALRDVVATGPVTLIYGAKDERHNQAVALAEFLARASRARGPGA